MKQKDFFENFLHSGFGEMMLFHFYTITSKFGHFDNSYNLSKYDSLILRQNKNTRH